MDITLHPPKPEISKGPLPDLFCPPNSSRVTSPKDWPKAAEEWRTLIIDQLFGGMPAEPEGISIETLCHSVARSLPDEPGNVTYRVNCHKGERQFSFTVRILFPRGPGSYPAIIRGDGCWWNINHEIVARVLEARCALVIFNRTEFAEDVGSVQGAGLRDPFLPNGYFSDPEKQGRRGGLYSFLDTDHFGALSAWAWGFKRCVDLLQSLPFIDAKRIAVTGHSRGGKAALLAGLSDARIGLINDNAAGAGGSSLFRHVGHGGESISLVNVFPSWFGRRISEYVGREEALLFDQHCLLAALAPRPVLMTYATGDRWSNPEGMILSAQAARAVYELVGDPIDLAYHLRAGGHAHRLEDWDALIDFVQWKWMGGKAKHLFNQHPYTYLNGF